MTNAKSGVEILKSLHNELTNGYIDSPQLVTPLLLIEQSCKRLHGMVRQLRNRHDGRYTLDVQDEYDLQDLFHALLHLYFDDIRAEEYTPSYAGKHSRMEFLLEREKIVVELKKTRNGLGSNELTTQLADDVIRYQSHPSCKTLVCFVYDPEERICNPRGVEDDLNRKGDPIPVKVFIQR